MSEPRELDTAMNTRFLILIVDDNPNNLFTLRALLKRLHDCEVIEAASGEEALGRVVERPVDLILLDVQMPGMDGFETARHLQMTERTRNIPIIFITAVFKAEEFIRRGYDLGAVDYLTKPIDDNLLLNRIRLYQAVHRREHQLASMVNELQRNEQALASARDAAEAANRAKSIFLANMSHELRTPLNAILGFAQLMARDRNLSPQHQRDVGTINKSGQHLLSLINDVLEISRIESGRQGTVMQAFDIQTLLNSLLDIVSIPATTKGVLLRFEASPRLPRHVRTDLPKLRQIVLNLLGNAVKYTDKGEIVVAVDADIQGGQALLRIAVRDTGVGIDAAELPQLFNAFFQAKHGVASGEGTGLGLAISRSYARLLGGDITVESTPGQGSCFRLSLPVEIAEASEAAEADGQRRIIGLAPNQPEVRVLVVEDDDENMRLLVELLKRGGFCVATAKNGREAVEKFTSWQPHFVWMDMKMPEMDGYEATRRIRELPTGAHVPIVSLTAAALEEDRVRIMSAGCDEVQTKPLDEALIFQSLARHLDFAFIHETPDDAPVQPKAAQVDLMCLPATERQEMLRAAVELDREKIESIADSVAANFPAQAAAIHQLAQSYLFDDLASRLGQAASQ